MSDLNELQRTSTMAADIPIVDLSRPFELAEQLMEVSGGPSRFSHDATAYVGSLVALVANHRRLSRGHCTCAAPA